MTEGYGWKSKITYDDLYVTRVNEISPSDGFPKKRKKKKLVSTSKNDTPNLA